MESMSAGALVVGCDGGGTSEIIDHEVTGWLVNCSYYIAISDKVLEAWEMKVSERVKFYGMRKLAVEKAIGGEARRGEERSEATSWKCVGLVQLQKLTNVKFPFPIISLRPFSQRSSHRLLLPIRDARFRLNRLSDPQRYLNML